MKWAILSDIHGNASALQRVLAHMKERQVKQILFTGDLVGHGPDSEECTQLLHQIIGEESWAHHSMMGNNDRALYTGTWKKYSSDASRASLEWADDQMSRESRVWLQQLSDKPIVVNDKITITHGTLMDATGEFTYMYDNDFNITESFKALETKIGVFGHTHRPVIYKAAPKPPPYIFDFERLIPSVERDVNSDCVYTYSFASELSEDIKFLICAGSVGQPRDNDPRAAYVIIDDEKKLFEFVRLAYDIEKTIASLEKIRERYPHHSDIIDLTIDRLRKGR